MSKEPNIDNLSGEFVMLLVM
jgi:hypothetical protein